MPRSDREVLREGWLIKSPSPHWKLKLPGATWTRRYFVLSSTINNGNLVSYFEYFTNEQKHKKHGEIKLNEVTQVDSYLTYEARKNKVYQWIFDLRLQKKQIFLVANDEKDMNDWVHHICSACQLERDEEETETPHELSNMLNDSLQLVRQGEISNGDSARLHLFSFGGNAHNQSMDSVSSFDHDDFFPHYLPPQNTSLIREIESESSILRSRGAAHYVSQRSAPDLKSPSTPNGVPKGYVRLENCLSAAPRPGYHGSGPTPQLIMDQDLPPPPTPAPGLTPQHGRGHSSDSTASGPSLSMDGSSHSLQNIGVRSASFGSNRLRPSGSNSVLDSVVPPSATHHSFTVNYNNEEAELPPEAPAPQNAFGSLKREKNNNNNKTGPALESRGGFHSLPRMPRARPALIANKSLVLTEEKVFLASPKQGYTSMTGKIAVYEHMSPFAGSFSDDEEVATPKASTTAPPSTGPTSDSQFYNNLSPVNKNESRSSQSESESDQNSYLNCDPKPPSPPGRIRSNPPVSSSGGDSPPEYCNQVRPPPPPIPDRSLKPSRTRSSGGSEAAPQLPLKSPTAKKESSKLGAGWRVERQSSFVRKQKSTMNQMPKLLPKTSVAKGRGVRTQPRTARSTDSEHASSLGSAPLSVPVRQMGLEYIMVETGTPPSARTPSPSFLKHQNNGTDSDNEEPPSVKYTDINLDATKAVKEIGTFRTLERQKKDRGRHN